MSLSVSSQELLNDITSENVVNNATQPQQQQQQHQNNSGGKARSASGPYPNQQSNLSTIPPQHQSNQSNSVQHQQQTSPAVPQQRRPISMSTSNGTATSTMDSSTSRSHQTPGHLVAEVVAKNVMAKHHQQQQQQQQQQQLNQLNQSSMQVSIPPIPPQQQQQQILQQTLLSQDFTAAGFGDPKRKRGDEEQWYRNVRRKVEVQRKRLEQLEEKMNSSAQEVFKLFNDLQGVAKDCEIQITYPEIVIVGMQSDGNKKLIFFSVVR
jgi:hypothetical protein